jgi:two-component system alkaline phosphatase synthesis response regulator PhoP
MADVDRVGDQAQAATRPRRVLVCDDEEVLRKLVRATLAGGDRYEITEACDGDEALAMARSEHPELILLDVMMPGRSGTDVLAEIRRDPATSGTPVIVLTARAQASDRKAALNGGADRYLTKPFSPHALAALVEELLGTRE